MKSLTLRLYSIVAILALSLFIFYPDNIAYADHSLGDPCYACHNLKSNIIIVGSRSISNEEFFLGCDPDPDANIACVNPDTTPYTPFKYITGGPFDCSFCHASAQDPVAEFGYGTLADPSPPPSEESSHPVDVVNDEDSKISLLNAITCNDCHNLSENGTDNVNPRDIQTKDDSDGYPNHNNITPGFFYRQTGGGDYPDDASNRAHLTSPYGKKAALDSPNRVVDWGGPLGTLNYETLLCFICHSSVDHTGEIETATYSNTYTRAWADPANNTSIYSIEAEYNSVSDQGKTAGHVILFDTGLWPGDAKALAPGDKMPCYNCHESHAVFGAGSNKKLVKSGSASTNLYKTTTFGADYNDIGLGLDERPVCAGCHDTNLSATAVGTIVEGMDPVDPTVSTVWGAFHVNNGVSLDLITGASCLANTGLATAGCHANTHNPKAAPPEDDAPCYPCHGAGGSPIIQVNDGVLDGWGRGGDFGTANTKIDTIDTTFLSVHNVDFDAVNHGADTNLGTTRGSCTVCHTVDKRANDISYHGDGDPRNDFRDVDPNDVDTNELQGLISGRHAPVFINDVEGYRYEPEWLLCVDCHDDEQENVDAYYGIIGNNVSAPLNLDEFTDLTSPYEYVYGAGDFDDLTYYSATFADKLGAVIPDDNATPVKRYNMQSYKAHYYQTDGTQIPSRVWQGADIPTTLTDPTDNTYSSVAKDRIINCLACHNGHGSRNAYLYRSPDPLYTTNHPNGIDKDPQAGARFICLDCHDDRITNQIDFPVSMQVTKDDPPGSAIFIPAATPQRQMWKPLTTDRYNIDIAAHKTDGSADTISCSSSVDGTGTIFKCHNTHAPSCEACHAYPPVIPGGLDAP